MLIPVLWNLKIGPVSSATTSKADCVGRYDCRRAQRIAHLEPVILHIAEVQIFNEELGMRMILEDPPDDLDHSTEGLSILSIESFARVFAFDSFRTTIVLSIWKQAKLGEVHTFCTCSN